MEFSYIMVIFTPFWTTVSNIMSSYRESTKRHVHTKTGTAAEGCEKFALTRALRQTDEFEKKNEKNTSLRNDKNLHRYLLGPPCVGPITMSDEAFRQIPNCWAFLLVI